MANRNDCFIHPLAAVEGLVEMGEECSIWPGAVLRGDMNHIRLGRFVNIQDNCTLHVDGKHGISIGDYSLVGHNAVLHGCRIGRACLVGIGCVILDGAEIGDGAMVTAGCFVRGDTRIPPRSLVVQKAGQLKIFNNKSRVLHILIASLEYAELARRHQKKQWGPFTPVELQDFDRRARRILEELGF